MAQDLDGRQVGVAAHQLIAEVLRQGDRGLDLEQLFRAVGQSSLVRERVGSYRMAARQRLATAIAVYLRLFAPGVEWTFTACEVQIPGARLDLVFEREDGAIRADEIKSGQLSALEQTALEAQLQRQLAGGREHYGPRFLGVRAILLWAPSKSWLARADGSREPLHLSGIEDGSNVNE